MTHATNALEALTPEQRRQWDDLLAARNEPLDPELVPYVVADTALGEFVKHPLVFGPATMPGYLNRQLRAKNEALMKATREHKWNVLLWLHERPWRMPRLGDLFASGTITKAELGPLLVDTWLDTELPHRFGLLSIRLFRAAGFVTDAPRLWAALPDTLTVYRGASRKPGRYAISWTLARGVGEWYARRFGRGEVWQGDIAKAAALAYVEGRGEAEVVIEPRHITNLHTVTMGRES